MMCPIDDNLQELYGDSFSNANGILFHMLLPIATVLNGIKSSGTQKFLMWNVNLKVDYFITNYKNDVKFNKMIFRFEELNRFIPSICNCAFNENHSEYAFMNCVTELGKCSFEYCNSKVELVLRANSKIKYKEKCCANSFSEIVINFDYTSDMRFIIGFRYYAEACITMSNYNDLKKAFGAEQTNNWLVLFDTFENGKAI